MYLRRSTETWGGRQVGHRKSILKSERVHTEATIFTVLNVKINSRSTCTIKDYSHSCSTTNGISLNGERTERGQLLVSPTVALRLLLVIRKIISSRKPYQIKIKRTYSTCVSYTLYAISLVDPVEAHWQKGTYCKQGSMPCTETWNTLEPKLNHKYHRMNYT